MTVDGQFDTEVSDLITRLHQTEQRLRELTADEVDAVTALTGTSYLLRQAQERLRDSEAAHRLFAEQQSGILNALPAHIALLDQNGVIVSVNSAWRTHADGNFLRQRDHGVGQNYISLCERAVGASREEATAAAAGIRSVLSGDTQYFALDYQCHWTGRRRWFRLLVTPLISGGTRGAVAAHIDVTDRKLIEEDLSHYVSRLAALVEAQQALAIATESLEQLLQVATVLAQQLTGAEGATLATNECDELVVRATSGLASQHIAIGTKLEETLLGDAASQASSLRFDDITTASHIGVRPYGIFGCRSLAAAVVQDRSRPIGIITVVSRERDIFGDHDGSILGLLAETLGIILLRRQAEEELRVRAIQQAAIAQIGQAALAGLGIFDLMNRVVAVVVDTFGVEYGSILQLLPDESGIKMLAGVGWPAGTVQNLLLPPEEATLFGYTLLAQEPVVVSDLPADSRFNESPLLRQQGVVSGISVAIRDAEKPWGALGAFTKRGRTFTADDISFVQSLANLIAEANQRLQTQETLTQQAALLDSAHEAITVRGLDHKVMFWNRGAERIYGWTKDEAVGNFTRQLFYRDPADYAEATRQVFEHGEWSGIVRQRKKDGSEFMAQVKWTLMRDKNGDPQSFFSIASDVTSQLLVEEQLRRSQRLEAVGQLTGGVAHDFNNLLTVISINAELLVEKLADDETLRGLADMILSAASSGSAVINGLLAFARRQPLAPTAVDANALVRRMEPLLRRMLGGYIDIEILADIDLWLSSIDPSQLEAAILNLCINARDAMPTGGRITIETANVRVDDGDSRLRAHLAPGEYVRIMVSDRGCGIAPENLDRVFDPFFTTKGVGKGSGLGLSMVYGFIKQSRGHIDIDLKVRDGTVVRMFLPRSDCSSDLPAAMPAVAMPAVAMLPAETPGPIPLSDFAGRERILLVEDDQMIRSSAESQLVALGYCVTSARSGPEALDILRRGAGVDLLFTDVVMPGGMSGRMLAVHARKLRPDLNVLFTSGYAEDAFVNGGQLDGFHLLEKPYSRIELAAKVRAALLAPLSADNS